MIVFGNWVNEWLINVDLPWMAPRHQGRRCLCWRQRCRWERLPIRIREDRFSEWETSADSEDISLTTTSKTTMKRQSVVVVDVVVEDVVVVVVVVVLDPRVVVLKRKPARWYRPLSLLSSHYLPFPWLLPPCLHLWTLPLLTRRCQLPLPAPMTDCGWLNEIKRQWMQWKSVKFINGDNRLMVNWQNW